MGCVVTASGCNRAIIITVITAPIIGGTANALASAFEA
jgi:hypothetical protein